MQLPSRLHKFLRHPESLLLGVLAVAGGLVLCFMGLAEEVFEGETRHLDEAILLALRTAGDTENPIGPVWLEIFMRDITGLGSYAILWTLTLAAMAYLILRRRALLALLLAAIAGGAGLLNTFLKLGFNRPRPEIVAHVTEIYTSSFPSGHAMLSAVIYLTLGAFMATIERRLRFRIYWAALAVFLTLLVGFSRIYLGVHYPSDVLAGWTLGAAWALLGLVLVHWLRLKGHLRKF